MNSGSAGISKQMTAFTRDEQWDHNYEFYLIDEVGKIGRFDHVGWRLLPPTIAKSKENWKKVSEYFENLQTNHKNYKVCSDLLKHLDLTSVVNFEEYIKFYGEISSKGIFSYDSDDFSQKKRPYFRVTIPQNDLLFENLPHDIKTILEDLRLPETNFAKHSLISDEVINNL